MLIKRSNTGWMDGFYSVPAGALDGKETLTQAVIREAREETGIKVKIGNVQMVHTAHNTTEGDEWIGAFFVTKKWQGEPKVMEPQKHSEVSWVNIKSLPKNTIPYVKQAIKRYCKNIQYSEYGWNNKK